MKAINEMDWYERGDLPPVGTVCEWKHKRSDSHAWAICTIVGYHDDWVFVLDQPANGNTPLVRDSNTWKFRPLRSDRDRWVEAAEKLLSQCADDEPLSYLCVLTYDAMINGTLPIPEVRK